MNHMKKEKVNNNLFSAYISELSEAESQQMDAFFAEFEEHCFIAKEEKNKLRVDFERAILYYASIGFPLAQALERLNIENLGGFYARPPVLWFPLDDAAKIYPLSMKHGQMAVFRLAVYLKQPVVPELLQMALTFMIKRFPSFATTLKKGFFWHYLDTAKRRFTVQQEQDIPVQPLKIAHSGSQSFRVMYYENRISVEFFHVLTDGTGGVTFFKALITEYLRLCGITDEESDPRWDINAIPDSEEFENAFAKVPKAESSSGFVDKAATQMSGKLAKIYPCRVVHLKMNASELKEAAKKYHATISSYLLALMFLADKAATDDMDGDANIQVPVNMRQYYPSATVKNFSMYCGIRLPLREITDIPSIIGEISEQLNTKASKENMSEMLTATEQLVKLMRFVPLAVKQPAAKIVYGFLGDKIFSTTLSNLGVVQFPPKLAAEIESMDFVLGSAITNRANCGAITVGDIATFSVTKMTADPTFEETIVKLLEKDGVTVRMEGSEVYAV